MRRVLAGILAALMVAGPLTTTAARAEYLGSTPEQGVYVVQTQKHTCTLVAATMMLRNYASRQDDLYEQVTESAVRTCAWNSRGLKWDFFVGGVNVRCSHDIREETDKKAYLIECLKRHPEGVVIYDAHAPHAIWLFGYDGDADAFYCADTTTDVAGGTICLSESILRGVTQEEKIETLDRIWYIEN